MLTHTFSAPRPSSRVVILGTKGFVPRALATHFEGSAMPVLAIGSNQIDLLDLAAPAKLAALLQPEDVLVMTAALTPEKGRDVGTLIKNLRMAEHVVAALAARPCAHLVYFSSDAVYDPRVEVVTESAPAAPGDLYGVMHLARELALAQGAAKAGVPFCILRPCAIYGAGDTHNGYGPNRFVRSALTEGKIKLFGGGEETRDHVFIGDVVGLTAQVIAHRSTGTLNLISGHPVTFAKLADAIALLVGKPVTLEAQPRANPVTHRRFDVASLHRAFPSHRSTPLEEGLAVMIRALQSP
jgi:UDP-glucose 4-epimerase